MWVSKFRIVERKFQIIAIDVFGCRFVLSVNSTFRYRRCPYRDTHYRDCCKTAECLSSFQNQGHFAAFILKMDRSYGLVT